MSRIDSLFKRKPGRVLNIYFTAGFPQLEDTTRALYALARHGADMIELGMPYSDPLADGPVIQHSSSMALANGMNLNTLFRQLADLRSNTLPLAVRDTLPVVLMGYMNPVLQYGFEKFCADAASVGIDGLILPDLPIYEFETEYGPIIKKHGLDFVFLVTPETPEDRVRKLDALTTGFLYAVSSSSTTGSDKNMTDVSAYLKKLRDLQLKNPILVGFGIKDRQSFDLACSQADGAIIGTAFIKALEAGGAGEDTVKQFLDNVL